MITSEQLSYDYTRADASSAEEAVEPALKKINMHINRGEFVAILGRNGSGKSTLARHINALLTPTGGTLWVNGMDTRDPSHTWDIRRSTGMVFQNPDNQIIATVVEEDVAFGLENLGVPTPQIRPRVEGALHTVGMSAHATSAPHMLSGGQKQRIAIAGVLAMRPDCIVLDEPTAMLDPSGRREVLDTVTRLNKEAGITIIYITHFMEEAARADRILVMDDGELVMDGTPEALFSRVDDMKALGLDVPPATALANELRRLGVPMSGAPLTMDEFVHDPIIKRLADNI